MEGRRYIDFDRQLRDEAECLIYKPIPIGIANKMLEVPKATNELTGVKQPEARDVLPSRPRSLLALANSLSNVSNLPVQKVIEKLEREMRDMVDESVHNWDFVYHHTGGAVSSTSESELSMSGIVRRPMAPKSPRNDEPVHPDYDFNDRSV
jgi:hypothetical protein